MAKPFPSIYTIPVAHLLILPPLFSCTVSYFIIQFGKYYIADVDAFDHRFFNITPLDAACMDPQERLFLQLSYHALLDAGCSIASQEGKAVGVYVGVMNNAYSWLTPIEESHPKPTSLFWSIANRVSYSFNWRGPSMAIDTACSSLTALHLAAQALRSGDCNMAIVGGVNLIVHPRQYENLCRLHMLSPSGICKPFGDSADGFVDGEGICAVVIKHYSDAVRDEDRIYAILRASAISMQVG